MQDIPSSLVLPRAGGYSRARVVEDCGSSLVCVFGEKYLEFDGGGVRHLVVKAL